VPGLTKPAGIRNLSGSLSSSDPAQVALTNNRTFLVAFAHQLIEAQAAHVIDKAPESFAAAT
jgi:hypothetical protein